VELYLHSPIRLHGVVLSYGEHRDDLPLPFTLPALATDNPILLSQLYEFYTK
jgi:hypothetical protein